MARGNLPQGQQGTRVFSGARAIFKFNNSIVGFASGISGSEEIMYEPVDTLDSLAPREHVPVGYRVSFSAQVFRTIAIGAQDDVEGPGSLKQQNIFPKFTEILKLQGVDALLQDSVTEKVLALLQQCKAASYNWNVTARGIVGQNINFVGIRLLDEAELTL